MTPIKIVIPGAPRTKKNSMRFFGVGKRPVLLPSEAFCAYQAECKPYLERYKVLNLAQPLTVVCKYYMNTHRKCDLTNLLEATDDILVHAGVLNDDNSKIIVSHDGSRVYYDKDNPRVEIIIEDYEQ